MTWDITAIFTNYPQTFSNIVHNCSISIRLSSTNIVQRRQLLWCECVSSLTCLAYVEHVWAAALPASYVPSQASLRLCLKRLTTFNYRGREQIALGKEPSQTNCEEQPLPPAPHWQRGRTYAPMHWRTVYCVHGFVPQMRNEHAFNFFYVCTLSSIESKFW
jgi:hypothetical protein